ncbi:MAG: arylsulfatase [Acidobacteria bacterium]|nr:arylsulfatase [Acidobacteriota bacterium]
MGAPVQLRVRRAARALFFVTVIFIVPFSLCGQSADERTVLPIPPPRFSGTITPDYATSTKAPAPPLSAPANSPNILLILLDDAGYGQTSTFGGLIPTPTLDALAANGLRYTRFHVAALCSPTRAALLTGRNTHAVGMGTITNWSNGFPGYTGSIPKSAALISEILRENGYATAAFGKWHLVPDPEMTLAGPFDHWPTHQGFDYYYGFIGAETDQWNPELTEGTAPVRMVSPSGRENDYTLNEDLAVHARAWILQQKALAPDRPLFMYYATGATHAPLQAPRSWIDRFKGKFDMGWDEYRRVVFERQKKLGVVPASAILTPRPKELPAWESLSADQKRVAARLMEVFAGFMAQADHEIGRVIEAFRQTGQLDNTLVIFIAGDNGASLEGNLTGTDNMMEQVNGIEAPTAEILKHLDEIGGPNSNPHYPAGWAWAGNTPFQWGKRIGSHLGGTRDPMVVSWPSHIRDGGGTRAQYQNVTDVFPTILDAVKLPTPKSVNGVEQQVVNGVSFLDSLADPAAPEHRTQQYFEMHGNISMYSAGWVAAHRSGILPWTYVLAPGARVPEWELYNLEKDYSEANDLAAQNPDKLKALESVFDAEAKSNNVYPIDTRIGGGRDHGNASPPGGRSYYTFYPGATHLYGANAPGTRNRTHTFTAYVEMPASGGDGVLVAEGGTGAGYSLYIKDGHPCYTYNYFRREVTTISSPEKLAGGKAVIELNFAYDGGGLGKGAVVTLSINGKKEASAHLSHTVPRAYSFEETFDVGEDTASPVGPYAAPFPFTGTLERLELRAEAPPALTPNQQKAEREAEIRIQAARD